MDYKELGQKIKAKTYRTEHLILRPFCDTDEDGLLELFRDENTMRMDGDHPIHEKNEEFRRRIDLIRNGPLIWFFAEEEKALSLSDTLCFRMKQMQLLLVLLLPLPNST